MPFNHACPHCSNLMQIMDNLRGLQVRCPICNAVVEVPATRDVPPAKPMEYETVSTVTVERKTGLAVSSMVFGILGFLSCGVLGLLGLILGTIALTQASRDPTVDRGKGFAIAGLITGIMSLLLFAALGVSIFLPSLATARELTKRTVCASQLQTIYEAMEAHAGQHQGRYPLNLKTLIDQEQISSEDLICLSAGSNATQPHYHYVADRTQKCEEGQVLIYEDPANHEGEGGNMLFCGGEVRFVASSEWQQVIDAGSVDSAR